MFWCCDSPNAGSTTRIMSKIPSCIRFHLWTTFNFSPDMSSAQFSGHPMAARCAMNWRVKPAHLRHSFDRKLMKMKHMNECCFFLFGEPPVLDIFFEIVSDLNISKYIEYFSLRVILLTDTESTCKQNWSWLWSFHPSPTIPNVRWDELNSRTIISYSNFEQTSCKSRTLNQVKRGIYL